MTLFEMDRQTPTYKLEMGELSPVARKIVATMAHMQGHLRIKEISKASRIDAKMVSVYIGRLRKSDVVTSSVDGYYYVRPDLREWLRFRSGRFRQEFTEAK